MFCPVCGKSCSDTARFCQECATPIVTVLKPGSKLREGRYSVQRLLNESEGAMYLLGDHRHGRSCVLKEMIPQLRSSAEMEEFRERFRKEAPILSKLDHPNFPSVYDYFEENHQCYLVMEYIEGEDLESLLATTAPKGFPEERVRHWALTILSILEYIYLFFLIYSQKPFILYRSLKPSNLKIRKRDGRLFLIDFCMAESVHTALTHQISWDTDIYSPTRQIQGEPDVRSDLYALGVTMHQLLSGKPPVSSEFDPIRLLRPDMSQAIEAVLEKALKPNAHERFQLASEMKGSLEGHSATHVKVVQSGVNPAPPAASSIPATMTNPIDGAEMILIPAGEFLMGSPAGQGADDEHPQHIVYLDDYYIYKFTVTNEMFMQFEKETGYCADGDWKDYAGKGRERHPVVSLTWDDAVEYCAWAGGALPTEAQWEKAARGTDGRILPWGDAWDASKCNCCLGPKVPGMADLYNGRGTAPVGSFPDGASAYGVEDMAGNVWEWCADWFDANYYQNSPSGNPQGPGSGRERVVRGGSWLDVDFLKFRCADRNWLHPVSWEHNYGFRVCRASHELPQEFNDKSDLRNL